MSLPARWLVLWIADVVVPMIAPLQQSNAGFPLACLVVALGFNTTEMMLLITVVSQEQHGSHWKSNAFSEGEGSGIRRYIHVTP
ncbi:hypothetical protein MLD38_036436 [Melastoma candidum]|uniref:Uncharacterized protein n=1 Tax=Melastoma candidum TaxID=119954 RepID=A0ACB9LJN0_9MYRT|nr:hypothetical protein MLD38_036436 [Melastoma candidum]